MQCFQIYCIFFQFVQGPVFTVLSIRCLYLDYNFVVKISRKGAGGQQFSCRTIYSYFNVHACGNSMAINNYYIILFSSATPKQVKKYPFRRLLKGTLYYHRFAKKGTMYKQSQVYNNGESGQKDPKNFIIFSLSTTSYHQDNAIIILQNGIHSILFAMKFELSKNNIIFLKKVSRDNISCLAKQQLRWYLTNYIGLFHRGSKIVCQLKTKVTNTLFIKTQMMCCKRAWQNLLVYCVISRKQIKNNTDNNSTQLHHKMRYVNKK